MNRSRLRNKYNKNRTNENWSNYARQRNLCVKILKKSKKHYFENLDVKKVTDTKIFWNTIKPLISNKSKSTNSITLIEDQKILKHEEKIANTLNKYFSTLTKKLKLKPQKKLRTSKKEIKKIINSFKDNPSIKKIKSHFLEDEVFSFREVTNDEILDAIKSLPTNKSSTFDDIPAKLLKDSAVIYSPILMKIFNNCLREGKFPDILKYSDITPVFKKGENTKKENYRPISSLSNFSKIFEKLIHSQISQFIESKLSDYLTGFRRNHNTQYALLEMIEKWKTFINRGFKVGALMMDLSKVFDTLNHYLLINLKLMVSMKDQLHLSKAILLIDIKERK